MPSPNCLQAAQLSLTPARIVAPVGSEVVLLASVCSAKGQPLYHRQIEWTLEPGGVGQFIAVARHAPLEWLVGFHTWPRKINSTHAIGSTSMQHSLLTRGTPTPTDDMPVVPGQAWITVSSPMEGTSYVTAYAPSVYGWDVHKQTAAITWIDAEFIYPPPAINPPGERHTLLTVVSRHSNHAPLSGWRVRYEITGGPPAGFTPEGAQTVEVVTNERGEAAAEIFQTEEASGTNTVSIQVLRPAYSGESDDAVIGRGATSKTWGAAPPTAAGAAAAPAAGVSAIDLNVSGPRQAVVGQEVTFDIRVTNRGTAAATGLVIVDRYDAGLEHQQAANPIERELGDLASGATRAVTVTFQVTRAGRLCNTVEIQAPDRRVFASQQACLDAVEGAAGAGAAAQAGQSALAVRKVATDAEPPRGADLSNVKGLDRAAVGDMIWFSIQVVNNGTQPIKNLKIEDHYDVQFRPSRATEGYVATGGDLVWSWEELQPGKRVGLQVVGQCTEAAAKVCNRVVVTGDGDLRAEDEACLEIVQKAQRPAIESTLGVEIAAFEKDFAIGDEATCEIRVTNNGDSNDEEVTVIVDTPELLTPLLVGTSAPTKCTIDGQQARFEPLDEIRAGETRTYRLRLRAAAAGSGVIQVNATSRQSPRAVTAEREVEVGG